MIFGIKELEITYHKKQIKFCSPVVNNVWDSPFQFNDTGPTDNWLKIWEDPSKEDLFNGEPVSEAGFFAHRDLLWAYENSSHVLVRGFGKTSVYDDVFRSQGMQIEAMILSTDCMFASHIKEFECEASNNDGSPKYKAVGYTSLRPIIRPGGKMKMAVHPVDIRASLKEKESDFSKSGMFLEPLCQVHYDTFLESSIAEFSGGPYVNTDMSNFFFPAEIVKSSLESRYGVYALDSLKDVDDYLKENYNYRLGDY